jgi:deoxyribodipyrimidine photo-lyase
LLTFFSIDPTVPGGNARNFTFMLEGLEDIRRNLGSMGAGMCIRRGDAVGNVIGLCQEVGAGLLVTDESHLREGRRRRETVARRVDIPMYQVDANVVVPVREIHGEQYAAYTIRPKLKKLMGHYLVPQKVNPIKNARTVDATSDLDWVDVKGLLKQLRLPRVPPSPKYRGGESQALRWLRDFVDKKLDGYNENRNDPSIDGTSHLSPYLRFGLMSPVRMLREVIDSGRRHADIDAFVDEAFVRRELAENFTFYNPFYRGLGSLPDWARATLEKHGNDRRPRILTPGELEGGETGDELWDAAQYEMTRYGKMAGYVRMYWGKRVLEWTRTPGEALQILLSLNDKYEIDGRSPNGYAGIMWCFGKHDRAFAERPIYGKLRYMSPVNTRKKFNVEGYLKRIGFIGGLKVY